MDISEQFVPPSAYPTRIHPDPSRRAWVITLHTVAGVLFGLSVPVGLALIGLAHLGGSCSGVTTARELADARWVMIEVGVVWSVLPFSTAIVARLLHSRWIVWVVLGGLVLALALEQAATTTTLTSLFCF